MFDMFRLMNLPTSSQMIQNKQQRFSRPGNDPRVGDALLASSSSSRAGNVHAQPESHNEENRMDIEMGQTARPVESRAYRPVNFASIPSIDHERLLRSLDLRKESDRIKTFDRWPASRQTVHPVELARRGFFFLGETDRVQCFSCGGVLRNWNYGDDVEREHRTNFPNCRLVNGTDTHNVPLPDYERRQIPPREPMQAPRDPTEAERRELENNFPCLFPVNGHMRSEDQRFETFDRRWPATRVRASTRQIAAAGFFFLGERDRVKCWYCNGGLQNWELDDEPWTEHAKWFPTCEFLLQKKGPDFVHRIVALFPNLPRPRMQMGRGAPLELQRRPPSPPPPLIDPRAETRRIKKETDKAMKSLIANTAREMGFEDQQIRRAIERKLREGEMFSAVLDLIEALSSQQEESSDEEEMSGVESQSSEGQPQTSVKEHGEAGAEQPSSSYNLDTESLPEGLPAAIKTRIRELQREKKCKICLDNEADIVFVPCGHLCCCISCAPALKKCPICRVKISKAIRTYAS